MGRTPSSKEPFDIDEAFRRLRLAVADFPKAAMFDLRVSMHSHLPVMQLSVRMRAYRLRDGGSDTLDARCRMQTVTLRAWWTASSTPSAN